jgi:hypothetical protein
MHDFVAQETVENRKERSQTSQIVTFLEYKRCWARCYCTGTGTGTGTGTYTGRVYSGNTTVRSTR